MPELEFSDELIPLTKHVVPKRRLNHKKIHRYRDVYTNDGQIAKIIIVEALDVNSLSNKQKETFYEKLRDQMLSDNSGLYNFYIRYSLGKRRRWEFQELPDIQETISSLSLLKFQEERTMNQTDFFGHMATVYAFHGLNPCHNYWNADLTEYQVKTKDESKIRKGKFNRKQKILDPEENPKEVKFHVQYHITEFKHNRKIHNSERFWFWRDGTNQHCKPQFEGCQLNSDVYKLNDENYVTAMWELNGTNFDLDEYDEEVDSEIDTPKAKGLTLADFLVPMVKRQSRRRTISDKWVIV